MSKRLYVGTRKGLFTLDRRGDSTWEITGFEFRSTPVVIVLPDPRDESVYAALDHGHFGIKMHRSLGADNCWEECAAPAYPAKPDDEPEDIMPLQQTPVPWKLANVWALEPAHPNEPGVLWCGTIPGGLFRSMDRGTNWELIRSLWDDPKRREWWGGGADLPGIDSVCVDPRDARHVSVAVSIGGVWVTRDGGETWNCQAEGMWASYVPPELKHDPNQQDVHMMVQCAAEPDNLWVQHHNAIFRSTDGAASWQEIKEAGPSTFGFAVAVHPADPQTAWFVPAQSDEDRIPVDGKVVVTRTRDGGRSFETLRKGLPQEHAYDLVYRHALDVDETGERLAFGSTTGSLWTSEDQGDTWQTISEHLPPVYCVRFVK